MPEKKERWGAYIKPDPKDFGATGGQYLVSIGKYDKALLKKGEVFTSSPAISKRIEEINSEHELKGKVHTGVVSFYLGRDTKKVGIGSVVPFTGSQRKLPTKFGFRLMGLGLASRIELKILKDMQKRFPGYKVAPLDTAAYSGPRERMVRARGTKIIRWRKETVSMQGEIQRIADYIGLKGMEKRKGEEGVKRLLAAREKARARKPAARRRPR